MFRKIWQTIQSLFGWFKKRHPEKTVLTETGNDYGTCRADQQPAFAPLRRLSLLTTELKPYHNKNKETRVMCVEQFTDAYRFMLLLCGGSMISLRQKEGYMCYNAELPGIGTLTLAEKNSTVNKAIVAALTFDTTVPGYGIKEIRFIRDKHLQKTIVSNRVNVQSTKSIKNENNQVKKYRRRCFSCQGKSGT